MEFHFRRHFRLRPKMKNAFRSTSNIYHEKVLVLVLKLRSWSWSSTWKSLDYITASNQVNLFTEANRYCFALVFHINNDVANWPWYLERWKYCYMWIFMRPIEKANDLVFCAPPSIIRTAVRCRCCCCCCCFFGWNVQNAWCRSCAGGDCCCSRTQRGQWHESSDTSRQLDWSHHTHSSTTFSLSFLPAAAACTGTIRFGCK